MGEATQILFEHKEVVTALLKQQGIHEGLWSIVIEIGFSATSVPTSPDGSALMPAAINLVQRIGLKHAEKVSNLTVDAAEVNPAPKTATKEARKKKAK